MKEQYFGDVNDYRKFGLLRIICQNSWLRPLIVWMLTENDDSKNGNKRGYLEEENAWKHFDSELFAYLKEKLDKERAPNTNIIEESSLLPGTGFFRNKIHDQIHQRTRWQSSLFMEAAKYEMVFFDPDNGIEIKSKPIGRKYSSKYVYWFEIEEIWKQKKSILIYQHFPRIQRDIFVRKISEELHQHAYNSTIMIFRTPQTLFLFAVQPIHGRWVERIKDTINSQWKDQINAHVC
jgi:hypothetical protein